MTNNKIAAINNVALAKKALQRTISRASGLPGLVCFHGHSGLGKSMAASVLANSKARCYYVQCKSTWTRKTFLQAILKEMGITPESQLADMTEQICTELMLSERPLIIDEADYLAAKESMIMMVMDLFEGSQAPIMLIGEEKLKTKLKRFEKIDNRILCWVEAQPCDIVDAKQIAAFSLPPEISVSEELLENMLKATQGVTRRICVSLEDILNFAIENGVSEVTADNYHNQFFIGHTPRGRVA